MRNRVIISGLALAVLLWLVVSGPVLGQGGGHDFHHMKPGPKIDYEARFAAAASLVDSREGREVLDRCLDAYGGRKKLAALQGFRLHYDMLAMLKKSTQRVVKSFARGRRYSVERGREKRFLDGDRCWYTKDEMVAPMDSGRYRAELFSYLTLAMPLAAETEPFADIRYGTEPGDSLLYLYFDKPDSVLLVLGVEPGSYHIVKSTGVVRQGEQRFVFINQFDDFREVEGYLFPHHLVNISMGLKVADSRLGKVEINPRFGETYFRPEGEGGL